MSATPEAVFGALSAEDRGFVLGATLLNLEDEVAQFLAGPGGQRCEAALKMLARLPREGKAARLGQLARELGAPYPPALDLVHPSWIRKVLSLEPSDLMGALVAGAPPAAREQASELASARKREGAGEAEPVTLIPEMATELRRMVFGAVAAGVPDAGPAVAPLFEMTAPGLRIEIRRWGARSLGASLVSAPVDIRARAMAGVGPAYAEDLRDACATADKIRRQEGEADVKAASEGSGGNVEERLELMGISALARYLATENEQVRKALAVRLPIRYAKKLLPPGVMPGEPT